MPGRGYYLEGLQTILDWSALQRLSAIIEEGGCVFHYYNYNYITVNEIKSAELTATTRPWSSQREAKEYKYIFSSHHIIDLQEKEKAFEEQKELQKQLKNDIDDK